VSDGEFEQCVRCLHVRPIAELYRPKGSLVRDMNPPIYEWQCVDYERCSAAVICGHCDRPITQASRGIAADGTVLCHTGTLPPGNEPQDCYRLVTQYSHAADGSCCRDQPKPPWKSFADTPDDFAGCSRSGCRRTGVHSLKYGECEYGQRPSPEFGFWRTFTAEDGYPSIGMASIPLLAVLPWAKNLTVGEQDRMLEATADSHDPAEMVERWRQYAEAKDGGEEWARVVGLELGIPGIEAAP